MSSALEDSGKNDTGVEFRVHLSSPMDVGCHVYLNLHTEYFWKKNLLGQL